MELIKVWERKDINGGNIDEMTSVIRMYNLAGLGLPE